MKDKIRKAKQFVKEHSVETAFVAGSVVGAVVMRRSLQDRLIPDLDVVHLNIPQPYFDGLMAGRRLKLNTDLGVFSLGKLGAQDQWDQWNTISANV